MKKQLFSILYMFIVTLFFTSVVSGVKLLNQERIDRNQDIKLQKIILQVLDIQKEQVSEEQLEAIYSNRVKAVSIDDRTIHIGYDADSRTISGYAFPVNGSGFWGPIHGMAAVGPDAANIIGIAFYKHTETPGLGGRITEEWFTTQFIGLPMYQDKDTNKIFYFKPEGTGAKINELDAITGATGTSRAVEVFLNNELKYFQDKIWETIKEKS